MYDRNLATLDVVTKGCGQNILTVRGVVKTLIDVEDISLRLLVSRGGGGGDPASYCYLGHIHK